MTIIACGTVARIERRCWSLRSSAARSAFSRVMSRTIWQKATGPRSDALTPSEIASVVTSARNSEPSRRTRQRSPRDRPDRRAAASSPTASRSPRSPLWWSSEMDWPTTSSARHPVSRSAPTFHDRIVPAGSSSNIALSLSPAIAVAKSSAGLCLSSVIGPRSVAVACTTRPNRSRDQSMVSNLSAR